MRSSLLHKNDFADILLQVLNKIRNLPIYPGVPLVSDEFYCLKILAIPKSVIRRYPF